MTAALGALAAAPTPLAPQAQALLAGLTPGQYGALRLWLIWLLDSWGALVYRSVAAGGLQPGAPAAGLLVSRPVRELLYGGWVGWALLRGRVERSGRAAQALQHLSTGGAAGPPGVHAVPTPPLTPQPQQQTGYEDALLLGAAAGAAAAAGFPGAHRLQPWRYTPSLAISFDTADTPLQYFGAGGWA